MFVMPGIHWFWIFWVGVVFLVLLAIVIAIIRGLSGPSQQTFPFAPPMPPGPPGAPAETPLDILARRFAKGEITAEEYEKGRDLLSGGGGGTAP